MIGHAARATKSAAAERDGGAEPLLQVSGLTRKGEYKNVDLTVRPGHCVALVGTLGSGRESLVRALFGAEPFDSGSLSYRGKQLGSWSSAEATRRGMAYVPAERKTEGMVGGMSAAENLVLARTGRSGLFVNKRKQKKLAEEWFGQLDTRPNNPSLHLSRFS